jgi:hypothetical protein
VGPDDVEKASDHAEPRTGRANQPLRVVEQRLSFERRVVGEQGCREEAADEAHEWINEDRKVAALAQSEAACGACHAAHPSS